MINWLTNKFVRYFKEKAISQIDSDPIGVARRHYKPIIDLLSKDVKINSLFWAGSYEFDLELINFFRKHPDIDKSTLDKSLFKKDSESQKIIVVFLVEDIAKHWFIVLFTDNLDLREGFTFLGKFEVNVVDSDQLTSEILTKII